jgi:predicted RNA-binding protein associated with RNAse of E/G family
LSASAAFSDAGVPSHPRVRIHYKRLPDRETIYDQRVVLERPDVVVTLGEPADLPMPLTYDGNVMLDVGALAVWFTFPGSWHDIARFHDATGSFTGIYANVLTPPVLNGAVWHTTDLFLDVWIPDGGSAVLLDEDELQSAIDSGTVDPEIAKRARMEADRLVDAAARGLWPPPIVSAWTLKRALETLRARSGRAAEAGG